MLRLALALVASYLARTTSTCSSEDERRLDYCLQPLINYANEIQSETSAFGFPGNLLSGKSYESDGLKVFQGLCRLYQEFKQCASSLTCDSVGARAMEASYGYMCGEGYEHFVGHVDCFMEMESNPTYQSCKERASSAIEELTQSEMKPEYLEELCNTMVSYLECSKPIILSHCGRSSWQLITKITQDGLRISMPQCNLDSI